MKTKGEADSWEGLTIKYIAHHKPELVIFDDGEEVRAAWVRAPCQLHRDALQVERIYLGARSVKALHELMRSQCIVQC